MNPELKRIIDTYGQIKIDDNCNINQIIDKAKIVKSLKLPYPGQGFSRIFKNDKISLHHSNHILKIYEK